MKISVDSLGSLEGLRAALAEVTSYEEVKGLLILTCAANGFIPHDIDPLLQEQSVPVVGGVFPAILADQSRLERGSIVVGLTVPVKTLYFDGLDREDTDFLSRIDDACEDDRGGIAERAHSVVVLLDAFAPGIDGFIHAVYSVFGMERTYLGGGAGSLAMDGKPSVLSNRGMTGGGATMMLIDTPSSLGVSHGWTPVAGPFRVTGSTGTVIETLDWEPAFEVYKRAVAEAGGGEITEETFFDIAKAYPFGITRVEAELVVRDPFTVQSNGGLVCVGSVPRGSFVHVLHGNERSLIAAAMEARDTCRARREASQQYLPSGNGDSHVQPRHLRIFFDCVSRVLFLSDSFSQELSAVNDGDHKLVGACSIGEVANNGDSYLEFYNKTAVVADIVFDVSADVRE